MRILLLILLAISNPVFGANNDDLVGTWKLVSWQVIPENGPPQDVFGAHPKGFLILGNRGQTGRSHYGITNQKRSDCPVCSELGIESAIRFELDFSAAMRCTCEHLVSGSRLG